MTPALAPLQLLLVALNWTADPATTYTVQTSSDLTDWQTLPFVVEGEGQQESHPIELLESPSFARLQFSTNGDSNENSLPDLWEWGHFGHFDNDPSADPDGDGTSTFAEWQAGTNPVDFFNGEMPVLIVGSGSEWLIPAGEAAPQTLAVGVYHLDGEPWVQAPVFINFASGFPGIVDDYNLTAVDSIELLTDDLGRLSSSTAGFHLLAPQISAHSELVRISCGSVTRHLLLRTTDPLPGGPPKQLSRKLLSDSSIRYQWTGSIEDITNFRLHEQNTNGDWIELAVLSPAELPEPDPATSQFTLDISPIPN